MTRLWKVAALSVLLLFAFTLFAGTPPSYNPGIIPPQATPFGHTYSEWAAAWWTWAFSFPADRTPILDPTGALASLGQTGKVWFLAGSFASGPVERTATIPRGKALFMPMLNNVWVQYPTDPPIDDACRANNYECLRLLVRPQNDGAMMTATLDNISLRDLHKYREESIVFQVMLPANNVLGADPPGLYGPAVDDGYYLMLAPLSVGTHTLHITGTLTYGFSLDVTYHLIVK